MNPSLDKHMHIRLAVKPEQIQTNTQDFFIKRFFLKSLIFLVPIF